MALEYDPILLLALGREIEQRYGGARARRLWVDPDRRRAGIAFDGPPALVFLLHPTRGHLLSGPPLPRSASGERRPFRNLQVVGVRVPPDERLLLLDLGTPGHDPRLRVVVELHTNQWNLVLLGLPGEEIREVLWPRRPGDRVLRPGARYRPAAGDREGTPDGVSARRWRAILEPVTPARRRSVALRNVAYLSGINVDWVLGTAGDDEQPGDLHEAHRRYRELLRAVGIDGDSTSADDSTHQAWLLPAEADAAQPYVHPLGRADARRAPGLLDAMLEAARRAGALGELSGAAGGDGSAEPDAEPPDPELLELRAALTERAEELDRRRGALARELEEADDPEELRAVGHLLLARKGRISGGESRVRLEDFDGSTRTVELDPALGVAENARRYYREAARRERAAEQLPGRIRETEERAERVDEAATRVRALLDAGREPSDEQLDRWWALAGGRPDAAGSGTDAGERLPYRRLRTSGGLEVRVGRSARDNETLTFHHSAPDDVWLHARQVPGSHVILRWGHREGNPPRRDLLEAAVAAAVNSKARHSGTVGVDWTRRKYVRSPRKSPPGVVVPERVKTLFVRPDESVVKRMLARAAADST